MKRRSIVIFVLYLLMLVVPVVGGALSETRLENKEPFEILGNDKTGYMKAPGRWNNFYTLGDTEEKRTQMYEQYGQEQRISSDYDGIIVTFYGFDVQQMKLITEETDGMRVLEDLMGNILYDQYGAYDEPSYEVGAAFSNEDGSAEVLYFVYDQAEEPAYTPMATYIYVSGDGTGHVWVFENVTGKGDLIADMIESFSLVSYVDYDGANSDDGSSIELVLEEREARGVIGNEIAGYMDVEGVWRSCHVNGISREQLDKAYELCGQESWISINNNLIVTYSGYDRLQMESITSAAERDQRMIELGDYALAKILTSFDEPKTDVQGAYRNPDGSVEMQVSVYDEAQQTGLTFVYVHIGSDDRGYVWTFENVYDETGVYTMYEMLDSFRAAPTVSDAASMTADTSPAVVDSGVTEQRGAAYNSKGYIGVKADECPAYPVERADSFEYQIEKENTVTIKKYVGTNSQFTIPDKIEGFPVTRIDHSFGSDEIKHVVIPEGVEKIATSAFYYCDNLESIWIPSTVTEIGTPFVQNCPRFEECAVSANNPVYYAENGVLFRRTYQYGYEDENGIVLVSYPSAKQDVQYSVPDGVVYIAHGAFSGAKRLNSIELPDSISYIFMSAFFSSGIIEIELPSNVKELQEGTFADCDNLRRVYLPKDLAYFGPGVFSGCNNLREFIVHPDNPVLYVENDVLLLREGITVYDYTNPQAPMGWYRREADGPAILCYPAGLENETYKIPKNVKTIMDDAFSGSKLTSICIPSNINTIGHDAFYGCEKLKSVEFEDGIKYLGDRVFQGCISLESIILPNTLEYIGMYTFSNTSLKEIAIPERVTSIGTYAFLYNQGITLTVQKGSYAEEFAEKNGYDYVIQPRKGDKSNRILEIKLRMRELGYYRPGADVDGKFNDLMEERLKQFQKNNGLEVTGTFNQPTELLMFSFDSVVTGPWYQ